MDLARGSWHRVKCGPAPEPSAVDAAVKATGAAVLDGMGTDVPNSARNDPVPMFAVGATVEQKQRFQDLQGKAEPSSQLLGV